MLSVMFSHFFPTQVAALIFFVDDSLAFIIIIISIILLLLSVQFMMVWNCCGIHTFSF